MRPWTLVAMLSLTLFVGCSKTTEPVPVAGVVKTASGKPVSGLRLILEPVGGPTIGTLGFPLNAEGRFEGAAKPGNYTFYLARAAVEMDDDGRPVNPAEAKKLR